MNYFFPWQHNKFVHLLNQFLNIVFTNDFFGVFTSDIIAVLNTAYMLSSYTDYYILNVMTRIQFGVINCLLNRLDGFGNVVDHTTVNPKTFRFTNS